MTARFLLARNKAAELIEQVGITAAPVSLELIAKHLKAEIHFEPFPGELSGMMHRMDDGTSVIGVNATHPRVRKRFTVAHEIAHLVLHTDEGMHFDESFPISFRNESSSLATDDREIEANQFAAALLMPEAFLKEDVEMFDGTDYEDAVSELAKKYQVSIQAMSIRLGSLGLIA